MISTVGASGRSYPESALKEEHMKRVFALAGSIAMIASMDLVGNAVAAQHHGKLRNVTICTSTPYGVSSLVYLSQGIRNGVNIAIQSMSKKMASVGIHVNQFDYDYASLTSPGKYDANRAGLNAQGCIGIKNSLG